ncbi:plasminogen-like [Pecten maximus]|uniref:plasminogen-like n=1 Tax=Pecten maximus TaxID=6579 RepID=UPI001458D45E|nr:plasminogen-like [Pecten maximus]
MEISSPTLCVRECITFSLCTAVNIFPETLLCELILENSTSHVTSLDGMTIDAKDIPEEYAGKCYGHTCQIFEKCVTRLSGSYVCIPFQFCDGPPGPVENTIFSIDSSGGISTATFSCVPMSTYSGGDTESVCNPLTRAWTLPTIVCSANLPEACGTPPSLAVPHQVTYPFDGDELLGAYTCPSRSGDVAVEHCPVTKCTGIERWTKADVSCSVKDCYASGNYEGKVNCTVNGRSCQRWDSKSPHFHLYGPLDDSENYCRIVDSTEPWCFTTDSSSRWEYCVIQQC